MAVASLVALCSTFAWSRSGGLSSSSCTSCHGQNGSQQTTISINPATFKPGDTVTVVVRISGSNKNAGFWLSSDGVGSFKAPGGTKIDGQGNVIHSTPKAASNGAVVFEVPWTAPATAGGVIFNAASLMGNGSGGSSGDFAGSAVFTTAFGCSGTVYYRDYDGDGVGSTASGTIKSCSVPMYYATTDGDCDENDERVFPGAPERCNKRDDNCDGQADEGLVNATTWPDSDKDGYGDKNGASQTGCSDQPRAPNNTDCNDTDATVNPKATETCNQKDDNCDGRIDEGAQVRCGVGVCAKVGPTCNAADCTPGVPVKERCNGLDDDCDGIVDNAAFCDTGLTCIAGQCLPPGTDASVPMPSDSGVGGPGEVDAGAVADGGAGGRPRVSDDSCSAVGLHWPLVVLAALALRKSTRRMRHR
jgi:Putative metal-binding motif